MRSKVVSWSRPALSARGLMIVVLLALVVLIPQTSPANAGPGSHVSVVGGANAPRDLYRSVGVMVISFNDSLTEDSDLGYKIDEAFAFCSSTLIAPTVVLTAAHCLRGGKLYKHPTVVFGKSRLDGKGPGIRRKVESIAVNPHASVKHSYGDVGLAFLSKPVDSIEPMPLAVPGIDATTGPYDIVAAAGWGISSLKGIRAAFGFMGPRLKLAWGYLDGPGVCQKKTRLIRAHQFCVRRDSRWGSLCNGDSGGPMVVLSEADPNAGFRSRKLPPQRLLGVNSFTVYPRKGTQCTRKALDVVQSMDADSPFNSWVRRTVAERGIEL